MSIKIAVETFLINYPKAAEMFMNDDFCIGELSSYYNDAEIKIDFDYKSVKSYGGEGKGSDYWSVWKFYDDSGEVLVKFQGFYQSHYGSEFDNWKFVESKQKTITVWE